MVHPLPPYAELLGLSVTRDDAGSHLWTMPFRDDVIGRPGFLHGGAIAGLLEFAALGAVQEALGDGMERLKPINVSIAFMRAGRDHDTFAAGHVVRLGKRIANVEAAAWQAERDKPIATAQMTLLIRPA